MRRPIVCLFALIIVGALLSIVALSKGALTVSAEQWWQLLTGHGAPGIKLIVLEWRLPRVLVALVAGAALAISGAIFQSLLRNPLGSPDVLGFNTGAFSAVLCVMVFWPNQPISQAFAALLGGLLTALLVYGFAWKQGLNTARLVLIGIGIRALLMSLNSWLITHTSLDNALSAGLWSAGSLNGLSWQTIPAVMVILLCCFIAMGGLVKQMRLLEMGNDTARALGVSTERSRLLLMFVGVVLTAVPTAIIGPISFIALVAPQIAYRMCRSQHLLLWVSALCGGVLLLAADYVAQHLFVPYQLPVGVVTVSLGGIYLISLLIRESRRL